MMPAGPLPLRLFVVLVLAEVLAIAALVVLAMTRSGVVLNYPVTWRIFVLVPLFLYVGFGAPLLGLIILGALWQIATYPLRKKCKTCTRKAALYSGDWGTDLAGYFGPDTSADMNAAELGLCVDCAATRRESRARSHQRTVT